MYSLGFRKPGGNALADPNILRGTKVEQAELQIDTNIEIKKSGNDLKLDTPNNSKNNVYSHLTAKAAQSPFI
jgi:hypothetical protein